MQFLLNDEQEMLRSMARDFLEKECPSDFVRKMMDETDTGHDPQIWKKMADLGWQGLIFPEEYDGSEMDIRDLSILFEEMGRAVLPGPFFSTVVLAALPILNAGTEEQKQKYLTGIANGEIIMTLAVLEDDGFFWSGGINFKATQVGNEFVLNGRKMFVTDAKVADYILVAARTRNSADPEDGITLFVLDTSEWGVYSSLLDTVDTTRKQYELNLNRVPVSEANIIGELHKGWPILKDMATRASALLCAEMVGICDRTLEETVKYAKERIAFEVPIGSFQAIKHKCADMYHHQQYSRALMEWAVERLKADSPDADYAISVAKSFCGDAAKYVTDEGIQIHGGVGFTWEYDLHLWFKRARFNDALFGDSAYHRALIAESLD